MNKPVVIVGAGRHGCLLAETLAKSKTAGSVAGFLDDTKPADSTVLGYRVLGKFSLVQDAAFVRDYAWLVAIGDNLDRSNLCRSLANADASFVNAIHPTAEVSQAATLGRGVFIGQFASVGSHTTVGDWACIQPHAMLGAEVRVSEGAFIGAGSMVMAGVSMGARSFLGVAAVVCDEASVGADCVVGAKSLVISDVPDGGTVCGIPARPAPLTRRPFKR
jgi:sugar O-acyltransferase (sialic acid O-acetyltransferase NeuD family)